MFPLKDNIPNERLPLLTLTLIAINVLAYLLSIRHGGSFFGGPSSGTVTHYGAIPYELTHPGKHCDLVNVGGAQGILCQGERLPDGSLVSGPAPPQPPTWQTVFTAMFLHANFLHIAGNMLFLAIFGPNVEEAMGRVRFIVFYLLGGLVALAAQVAFALSSTAPTLGASGAIAAVLGGYILLYPRARVLTLVFIVFFATLIEIPAVILLGLWFLEQLYFGAAGAISPIAAGGAVAYFAHVGGFIFGLVLVSVFVKRHDLARRPVY